MGHHKNSHTSSKELTENDRLHIMAVFQEDVVPRLMRMGARTGNIGCEFAGAAYQNWILQFRSSPSGFDITGFEYDEVARAIDLAPLPFKKEF